MKIMNICHFADDAISEAYAQWKNEGKPRHDDEIYKWKKERNHKLEMIRELTLREKTVINEEVALYKWTENESN